jgi:hypothetical protein
MNALVQTLSGPTAFQPEVRDRSLSIRTDFDVGGGISQIIGRNLEMQKRATPDTAARNSMGDSSVSDINGLGSFINKAIAAAFPPPHRPTVLSLQPLQEWEGYVAEVGEEIFTARLLDVTAGGKYEEEIADFPIADLSDTDLELLKPGAVFRWVIGYQRQIGGTKRRVSQITFRRMPAWTKKDLLDATRKASSIAQSIEWT